MARYKIIVADNFHYMEEDEQYEAGRYESYDVAVAACREMVDRWLARQHEPGMTAEELYDGYISFGEDPFIVALDDAPIGERFSAWNYAKERSREICGD
jgi:hypothetical protein